MKTCLLILLAVAAAAIQAGCTVTREYRTYEDLRDERPWRVRVMTTDTTVYELIDITVDDSVLTGTGTHFIPGDRREFSGPIPLRQIVYIQSEETNFWMGATRTAFIASSIAFISMANDHRGLDVYWPSQGSCPYVYVWNGDDFVIQGETFGTAFGKGLETSTTCILPAASAERDGLRVRLTNERPETHYVNTVALFAYEVPDDAHIVLDGDNKAWPISSPTGPTGGPEEILARDGRWWKSDLATTHLGGSFRDVIEISMPHPDCMNEGSLVISAVNTRLINAVYDMVFSYLGDESLTFLRQVETDEQLIASLREGIREGSLRVEVFKNGTWTLAGVLPPEANDVPFSRVVRLDASGAPPGDLRVRLSAMADSWMIDAVEIDWIPSAPIRAIPVPLQSARHSTYGSSEAALQRCDSRYICVMPGERLDMKFATARKVTAGHLEYAFAAGGYLYEWLPDSSTTDFVRGVLAPLGSDRVASVRMLIAQRQAFLWPLYARWKEMVQQHAGMRRAPGEKG